MECLNRAGCSVSRTRDATSATGENQQVHPMGLTPRCYGNTLALTRYTTCSWSALVMREHWRGQSKVPISRSRRCGLVIVRACARPASSAVLYAPLALSKCAEHLSRARPDGVGATPLSAVSDRWWRQGINYPEPGDGELFFS
jgi:hypothetical protein